MRDLIHNFLQKVIFTKRFQNIGYLPRWIIFGIDVFIVIVACFATQIMIQNLNGKLYSTWFTYFQYGFVVFINGLFFVVFRTYSGIIRHSTFIDGGKLLVSTTASYLVLIFLNYSYLLTFTERLFIATALFITYVNSFLLLFLTCFGLKRR